MEIKLRHNNFFTKLNKEKKEYLKCGSEINKYVILHPYYHFKSSIWDKYENPDKEIKIYYNKYFALWTIRKI